MKTVLLALLLAIPASAQAQALDATAPIPATGGFFALAVTDLAASSGWYAEKLGLKVVLNVPQSVIVLEGPGLMVELVRHEGQAVARANPGMKGGPFAEGVFKGGFFVEDFDQAIATLRARGVQMAFGPFPPRRDQRANAIFKDNAGNLIQVVGKYAP